MHEMLMSVSGVRHKMASGRLCVNSCRRYCSALFVSRKRAKSAVSVLKPVCDVGKTLEDVTKLEDNLKARGLTKDVSSLVQDWHRLEKIRGERLKLEGKVKSIIEHMKTSDKSQRDSLKAEVSIFKEQLKHGAEEFWDLEESVMLRYLGLPNDLHRLTPVSDEPQVIHTHHAAPPASVLSHQQIAADTNCVQFSDVSDTAYYLKNQAAMFELASMDFFNDKLGDEGFTLFSNPDLMKTLVVEGCGMNFADPEEVFGLEATSDFGSMGSGKGVHLVGGCSLPAFVAYHAKTSVTNPKYLPGKYFCLGRSYTPRKTDVAASLYNVAQASAADVFVVCRNGEEVDAQCERLTDFLVGVYNSLSLPYRVLRQPAELLKPHETMQISLQGFSPYLNEFIEVAHLSHCSDYISKRLHMLYSRNGRGYNFLHVLHGRVLNVPRLLGLVMENSQMDGGCFALPEPLQPYVFF